MISRATVSVFKMEIIREFRSAVLQLASPVVNSLLYLILFTAIGRQDTAVQDQSVSFVVPGLMLLSVLALSISSGSLGVFEAKQAGTIYELLSSPVSWIEITLGYVAASAVRSILVGIVIWLISLPFNSGGVQHLGLMLFGLVAIAVAFSLFGLLIGIFAQTSEGVRAIPALVIAPLTFLGGSFFPIERLPQTWRLIAMANPIFYIVSAFRWTFSGSITNSAIVGIVLLPLGSLLTLCAVRWAVVGGTLLKG